MNADTVAKQQLLVNTTKSEYEYDREQALRLWALLQDEIPQDNSHGYQEGAWMSDDDRIIYLFELLNESIFGDMIFADLANFDQGSTLIERGEDE